MHDHNPSMIGRYEILHRLARGGMGEIFLARQKGIAGFERLVILKTLLEDPLVQDEKLDQFFDEARLVATLNHPNIVSVVEVGQHEQTYFIAMEFIKGVNLVELIRLLRQRRQFIPPRVGASIIRQAALGLDYAHNASDDERGDLNLVHRDVSPHNLMVRLDGVVKVVDFGIARAANRLAQTRDNILKGKLSYLSPEQIRGDMPDARSDQFSLGIVMWELIALQKLFGGDTVYDTAQLISATPIAPLVVMAPDCPSALDEAAQRMLQRRPEDRYERCAEVARALQDYLDASGGNADAEVSEFVSEIAGPLVAERTALGEAAASGPVRAICPSCKKELEPQARFCNGCGAAIADELPGAAPPTIGTGEIVLGEDLHSIGVTQSGASVVLEGGERYVEFSDTEVSGDLELNVMESRSGRRRSKTQFCGRADELGALLAALDKALAGRAERWLIIGGDGAGKSRLLDEVEVAAEEVGFTVAYARGASVGVPVALDMFRQWVLAVCNSLAAVPRGVDRLPNFTVGEMLARVSKIEIPSDLAKRLAQMFDGEQGDVVSDAKQHRERLEAALVQLLWLATQTTPLCLIIDDVQLADRASLTLLAELEQRLPGSKLLILATSTPDPADRLLPGWSRFTLEPLKAAEVRHIAAERLGAELPAELAQLVETHAKGNPLLVEQQIALLIEEHTLTRDGGGWKLDEVDEALLLRSPRDLTLRRAGALSQGSLLALRMATLVGEVFTSNLLEVACLGKQINVREAMGEAAARGLVVPLARSRDAWYFSHGCVRRHLLDDIPAEELKQLHIVVANGYDRTEVVPRGLALEIITRHLQASGSVEAAGPYAASVALRLLGQGAQHQAADMFLQGMRLEVQQLGAQGQVTPGASAHLFTVAEAAVRCLRSSDPERAVEMIQTLQERLPPHHAHAERALAICQLARVLLTLQRPKEAIAALDTAMQGLPKDADPTARAMLQAEWGTVLASSGEAKHAIIQLTEALQTLGAAPVANAEVLAQRLNYLSRTYCRLSRLYAQLKRADLARQAVERAREIAQRAEQPLPEIRAVLLMASQTEEGGDEEGMLALLAEAQELAEQIADPWIMTHVYYEHGRARRATEPGWAAELLQLALHNARLSGQADVERAVLKATAAGAPESADGRSQTTDDGSQTAEDG